MIGQQEVLNQLLETFIKLTTPSANHNIRLRYKIRTRETVNEGMSIQRLMEFPVDQRTIPNHTTTHAICLNQPSIRSSRLLTDSWKLSNDRNRAKWVDKPKCAPIHRRASINSKIKSVEPQPKSTKYSDHVPVHTAQHNTYSNVITTMCKLVKHQ